MSDDRGPSFIDDPAGRTLVRHMLAAVVDHPALHSNRFRCQNVGNGRWACFLAKLQTGSAFDEYRRLGFNVVESLLGHGWAEVDQTPEFRTGGWYRFTKQALNWYRENSGPDDEQVQAAIGRHFLRREEVEPNQPQRIDAGAIAQEIGIDETRVGAQARFLVGAGVLDDVGPTGVIRDTFYRLSQRDGFRWAAGGFRSVDHLNSTTVNVQVDVTIDVAQFLLDVGALPIASEEKQQLAVAAEELRREPTVETVGKLMAFGANTRTVVPAIVRVVAANGAALERALRHLPGV